MSSAILIAKKEFTAFLRGPVIYWAGMTVAILVGFEFNDRLELFRTAPASEALNFTESHPLSTGDLLRRPHRPVGLLRRRVRDRGQRVGDARPQGFQVQRASLLELRRIPPDAAAVLVVGPRRPFCREARLLLMGDADFFK